MDGRYSIIRDLGISSSAESTVLGVIRIAENCSNLIYKDTYTMLIPQM
jgi:hypothetical protein